MATKKEVRSKKPPADLVKVRRKGGAKRIEEKQPGIAWQPSCHHRT